MGKTAKLVSREDIHKGLSASRSDTQWSDCLDFRFANNRTTLVAPLVQTLGANGQFHTLVSGPNNNHYLLGAKKSYMLRDFQGELTESQLWAVSHKFRGDRTARESRDYQLIVQGRYTGDVAKSVIVTLVAPATITTEDDATVTPDPFNTSIDPTWCDYAPSQPEATGFWEVTEAVGVKINSEAVLVPTPNWVIDYTKQPVIDPTFSKASLQEFMSHFISGTMSWTGPPHTQPRTNISLLDFQYYDTVFSEDGHLNLVLGYEDSLTNLEPEDYEIRLVLQKTY